MLGHSENDIKAGIAVRGKTALVNGAGILQAVDEFGQNITTENTGE